MSSDFFEIKNTVIIHLRVCTTLSRNLRTAANSIICNRITTIAYIISSNVSWKISAINFIEKELSLSLPTHTVCLLLRQWRRWRECRRFDYSTSVTFITGKSTHTRTPHTHNLRQHVYFLFYVGCCWQLAFRTSNIRGRSSLFHHFANDSMARAFMQPIESTISCKLITKNMPPSSSSQTLASNRTNMRHTYNP